MNPVYSRKESACLYTKLSKGDVSIKSFREFYPDDHINLSFFIPPYDNNLNRMVKKNKLFWLESSYWE